MPCGFHPAETICVVEDYIVRNPETQTSPPRTRRGGGRGLDAQFVWKAPGSANLAWGIPDIYTWNPNDPCFDWKRPCFGGAKAQNRGQTGSRYIYIRYIRWCFFTNSKITRKSSKFKIFIGNWNLSRFFGVFLHVQAHHNVLTLCSCMNYRLAWRSWSLSMWIGENL